MTDEDHVAAKLRGFNCLIKFKDGSELFLKVNEIDAGPDELIGWFMNAEKFINGDQDVEYFPYSGIALARDSVKYVKQL